MFITLLGLNLGIHRSSAHTLGEGGHVPLQLFSGFTLGARALPPKLFLEFSIGQAKNSNSSNGGTTQKNLALTDRLWVYFKLFLI